MIVSNGEIAATGQRLQCQNIICPLTLLTVLIALLQSSTHQRCLAENHKNVNANNDGLARETEGPDWLVQQGETVWSYIVLHHSATESGSVPAIHAEHRQRMDVYGKPWLGIGYHFVIGNGHGQPDGQVAATFRWEQQLHGAHSGNATYNARGIGICLIGNFENSPPSPKQMRSLKTLVHTIARRHEIPQANIIGHSSVKATACPGKLFPLEQIRTSAESE
jgi:N-acetylmuramoyl-L-alanine amidase